MSLRNELSDLVTVSCKYIYVRCKKSREETEIDRVKFSPKSLRCSDWKIATVAKSPSQGLPPFVYE